MAVKANCALDQSTTENRSFITQTFIIYSIYLLSGTGNVSSIPTCSARSSSVLKFAFKILGKKNSFSTKNIINNLIKIIVHKVLPKVIYQGHSLFGIRKLTNTNLKTIFHIYKINQDFYLQTISKRLCPITQTKSFLHQKHPNILSFANFLAENTHIFQP